MFCRESGKMVTWNRSEGAGSKGARAEKREARAEEPGARGKGQEAREQGPEARVRGRVLSGKYASLYNI